MFEELKGLILAYHQTRRNQQNIDIKGQIIQYLKRLSYFRAQADTFGADILECYLPLLEPYNIRSNAQFIDDSQIFVIVEGMLKVSTLSGLMGEVFTEGMMISIQQRKNDESLISSGDTKMLKVCRNGNGGQEKNKQRKKLNKLEKQRSIVNRQLQKIVNSDPQLLKNKQLLQNHSIFSFLFNFDINYLVKYSKIQSICKSSLTHNFGTKVERLGFILQGSIKISHNSSISLSQQAERDRLIMDKYMIHKRKGNKSCVDSQMGEGQWLGLQEFLWNQPFSSKGQVVSHHVDILYVPLDIFKSVFKELTNYNLMVKLKGLIETKKRMMEKTIKSKHQKEIEMMQAIQKDRTMNKLQQRLQRIKLNEFNEGKNDHLVNRIQAKSHKKNKYDSEKQQNFLSQRKNYPQQCYMPDKLVHKVKAFEQKYETLPVITQRISLFPQQYDSAWVPLQFREKMQHLEKIVKGKKEEKRRRSFNFMNPQKIHTAAIFKNLTPQKQKQVLNQNTNVEHHHLTTKKSFESIQSLDTKYHFNRSICNNFRATKTKDKKLMTNLMKTLQIL